MNDDDAQRAWVRALFADQDVEQPPEASEPPPNPANGNHVPREGHSPTPRNDDHDMRTFTAELFNRAMRD